MKNYNKEEVHKAALAYYGGNEMQATIWLEKYALQTNSGDYEEGTPDDMHRRLAKSFASAENKYPNPMSEDEIYHLFANFRYVCPAGSILYGLGNNYTKSSLSNCTIVPSPEDNVASIFQVAKEFALLCRQRCGVGTSISSLRPIEKVNNSAGQSSGASSFIPVLSNAISVIGQGGRRGAGLVSIDGNHPDIENFITHKSDASRTKSTAVNISVKFDDEFMEAVIADEDYNLRWNGKEYKKVRARDLLRLLAEQTHASGEPGIMWWSRCIESPPECYEEMKLVSSNACSEQILGASWEHNTIDTCRLININLSTFVDNEFEPGAAFQEKEFLSVVRKAVRLGDDLVDLEIEKVQKIIDENDEEDDTTKRLFGAIINAAQLGRRIGIGTYGLADMLIKLNLRYDSDEAIQFVKTIYEKYRDAAYGESVLLAEERGAFPLFDAKKEKDNVFINRLPLNLRKPRRNIVLTTQPPTGTISIVSGGVSSGIEPIFSIKYRRRRKLEEHSTKKPDFIDGEGIKWEEYDVFHPLVEQYCAKYNKTVDELPESFVTAEEIDWKKRVAMQAGLQEFVDMAVSSTINVSKDTTVETIEKIFVESWKQGVKGITVYRDGSRDGVLLSSPDEDCDCTSFAPRSAPKRPEDLPCDIHHLVVHGEKWTVFVSHIDGMPFEVFGGRSDKITLPKKYASGTIRKKSRKTTRNRYDLLCGEGDEALEIRDLVSVFENPNNLALTRMISLSLRHGAAVGFVCDQLNSDEGSDMFSFAKSVARVLKRYIRDGAASGSRCDQCGEKLRYEGGCVLCPSCGASRC